jgi:hypothetical protein
MNDYGTDATGPTDEERGPWYQAARQRVHTPGVLLQLFGAVVIAFGAMNGALSLFSPETLVNWQYDLIEDMQRGQGAQQQQKLPPREDAIKSQRLQGPIYAVLWITAGIFIFIGGSKMKDLRGYGWGIAGSILSIFPGMCCCCIGLIPGIWALMVLLNADVKLAFSKNAPRPQEIL